ncbi:MAG: hypothetical protein N2Z76_02065 [Treponemataceae bacterium]|nr:hypothetical protein [Treponemataceae bacterium]
MDLVLVESIVILCAFLTLIRPFVKSFQDIEGTHFLSFFGFLLLVFIFVVYGFRPELIPLSIFVFFLFLTDIPGIMRIWRHLKYDDYGEASLLLRSVAFVLLLVLSFVAVRYAPFSEQKPDIRGFFTGREFSITSDIEVFVREATPTAPLVLVAPSVVGSAEGLTSLFATLHNRGFTVVTFSQESVDFFPSFSGMLKDRKRQGNLLKIGSALLLGEHWNVANQLGKELVKKREEALKLVFSWVYQEYGLRQGGFEIPFFCVAYDISAEAIENLLDKEEIGEPPQQSSSQFPSEKVEVLPKGISQGATALGLPSEKNPRLSFLRALVLVEKTTFTSYAFESLDNHENNSLKAFLRFFSGLKRANQEQKNFTIPVLFAVSDRITSERIRHSRYFFVEKSFSQSLYPRFLVAVEGAGIFDYSDIAQFYPLLELFFRGTGKRVITMGYYPETLGNLIGNFFVNFLVPPLKGDMQKVPIYSKTLVESNWGWKQSEKEVVGIP